MSDERKPMTDEELDAIKGRLAAITEWPWIAFCRAGVRHRMGATNKRLCSEADAAFVANAPTDIARLLAEVERLNKEANWLAKTLGIQLRDSCGCVGCWLSEFDMCNGNCVESLRKAASEAVEEEDDAK